MTIIHIPESRLLDMAQQYVDRIDADEQAQAIISLLLQQNNELKDDEFDKDGEIAGLEDQIDDLATEISELNSEVCELKDQVKNLEAELEKANEAK